MKNVVYQATAKTDDEYLGFSEWPWKQRFYNHNAIWIYMDNKDKFNKSPIVE